MNKKFLPLAAIVVVLIGIGYFWFGGTERFSKGDKNQLADINWKVFTSELEGYSLRYPEDWQLSVEGQVNDDSPFERVILRGPNRFELYILAHNFPRGYEHFEPVNVVEVIDNRTNPARPLWIYTVADTSGKTASLGMSDYEYQVGPEDFTISTFNGQYVKAVEVHGYYTSQVKDPKCPECDYPPEGFSPQEFVKKPEVLTAKEILQSLNYSQ